MHTQSTRARETARYATGCYATDGDNALAGACVFERSIQKSETLDLALLM